MSQRIAAAATKLDAWIEAEQFKGWDPFDALSSPWLKRSTFGNRRIGQVWVQLLKRCPVNLRPLLGIQKAYNPKAMGLFLASYWRKYRHGGRTADLERVRFFIDQLQATVCPGYHGACWGYNFDWPNRGFLAPAGTPTVVNTAFNGLALLDLIALPGAAGALPDDGFALRTARSACDFILSDLRTIQPAADEACSSYTPLDRRYVHNANVLGAWLLAEVAARAAEDDLARAALARARYSARRQRADGSWSYGEAPADGWVDNFHTGYVLVGLKAIAERLDAQELEPAIERGYRYWKSVMFLSDGTPKYYATRTYPIDSHSVAQAILTFLAFRDRDADALVSARRVALWGIEHMQAPQGYFYYQVNRGYTIRIPYMRWSQAWMQRALTQLLLGG